MADERINPETQAPERECEECLKWLGLYEFPKIGRSWICKVCQGLKPPPKPKAGGKDVGYQDYLDALKKLKMEKAACYREYQAKMLEFEERRQAIVMEQWGKYEKC